MMKFIAHPKQCKKRAFQWLTSIFFPPFVCGNKNRLPHFFTPGPTANGWDLSHNFGGHGPGKTPSQLQESRPFSYKTQLIQSYQVKSCLVEILDQIHIDWQSWLVKILDQIHRLIILIHVLHLREFSGLPIHEMIFEIAEIISIV